MGEQVSTDLAKTLLAPQWSALKLTLSQIEKLPADKAHEFAAFMDTIEPLGVAFIATGDEHQLAVIGFRLRTFWRDANFDALQLSDQAFLDAISGTIRSVAAVATLI